MTVMSLYMALCFEGFSFNSTVNINGAHVSMQVNVMTKCDGNVSQTIAMVVLQCLVPEFVQVDI